MTPEELQRVLAETERKAQAQDDPRDLALCELPTPTQGPPKVRG